MNQRKFYHVCRWSQTCLRMVKRIKWWILQEISVLHRWSKKNITDKMRFQTDLSSVEDHQTVNATLKRHTHACAKCIFKCVVGHDETLNFKQVKQSACRDEWSQKTPSKRVEIWDNMRHNQLGVSGIQSWSMSKNTSCVWSKNIPSTAVWHGLWGGGRDSPEPPRASQPEPCWKDLKSSLPSSQKGPKLWDVFLSDQEEEHS